MTGQDSQMSQPIQDEYDVVVIGAGPGGCTTATIVAEAGHSTLVAERNSFPRFHVGESLMPETYWTLKRLGVWDAIKTGHYVSKNGVQFVSHTDKESRPFFFEEYDPRECSRTWHVERSVFDQLLFDNAASKGADCRDNTKVVEVQINDQSPHSLTLQLSDGSTHTVKAQVVVDATGQSALLPNRLGLREFDPNLKKAAIWSYFEQGQRNGETGPDVTCILHTNTKECWFWYIPLSNGTISVGVVGDHQYLLKGRGTPEQTFAEEMDRCPGLKRRLENGKQVGDYHVAKEFTYKTKEHAGNGWVLVGDSYGFIDPIYSSGVFLALKSGEMAADAIVDAFKEQDLSAQKLGSWFDQYDQGVVWIRKLVDAFYTPSFSFGEFMKAFPHHGGNLTDLLVGRVYEGEPGKIFEDMDPWIDELESRTNSSLPSDTPMSS